MLSTTIANEFTHPSNLYYLNHAAVAPWPKRAVEAVMQFAQENGTTGAAHYPNWLKTERALREKLARLIGAPSIRNIALQKNTSEGLSTIAYGLSWQSGDRIIISDQEFPSNRIVWESLKTQGVEVIPVSLQGDDPEQNIIDQLQQGARLLSISSAQYGTGLTLDLSRLGQACQKHSVLFCVDAIQSLGALPFDAVACEADFVVADGHKWMLGPEGIALLYIHDRMLSELTLHQFGWHMVKSRGDYDQMDWEAESDATRYECGSPNMLGIHALNSSLELLLEVGIDRVYHDLMNNIHTMETQLLENPQIELITSTQRALRSGILGFKHRTMEPAALFDLLKQGGVVCACRGGGIRFSPHFYTPESVIEQAVQLIPR